MPDPVILTSPMREIPTWAVLQRRLFDEIERAWRRFGERFCEPDGSLRYSGPFESRDGVDDFYEPFFNWPNFYALGGSQEILEAAKKHWRGVTHQLTEAGMLTGEFENGYDWFHQGESLIFFYSLCAADPEDRDFRDRARRFAELYMDPCHGNYDSDRNIILAPHNGALGARVGVGDEWESYSARQTHMKPYGLPLEGIPGIESWDDLWDSKKADLMGAEMRRRARGDTVVNLAATSLVTNYWLYNGDTRAGEWVVRYVEGWRDRARANGGLIPDNVGPEGIVGSLQEGNWFGGHYGWNWPHGLPCVGMAALIGGMNAATVTGNNSYLDFARIPIDTVLDLAITASVVDTPMSTRENSLSRLGEDASTPANLVPHRYGTKGWFDYGPIPMELPTWLWWFSREDVDHKRLSRISQLQPEPPTAVKPFRDKAEGGHDMPWFSFLAGENPDYPDRALSMALGQVARRVALMESENPDPASVHIHFWQQVQPVVTEVLGQLISGAPQMLYNGGLPHTAVSYEDVNLSRPGLPQDVAALVSSIDGNQISLELVNLSNREAKRVKIRPGRFGERDIKSVQSTGEVTPDFPGSPVAYTSKPSGMNTSVAEVNAPFLIIDLPPAHHARLVFTISERVRPPRHSSAHNHPTERTQQ